MSNTVNTQVPFDEHAALEELERVRQAIERLRSERKAIEEEFERFTASFKDPGAPAVPPPPRVAEPRPTRSEPDRAALQEHPEPPRVERTIPEAPVAAPAPGSRPRRSISRAGALAIAGTMVVLGAGSYVMWTQSRPRVQAPAARPAERTESAQPKALPTAPPVQPAHDEIVLTTTRAAWVRVTADGVPVVEREIPANTRLPLVARQKIVLRTGNAGAVRITIGGIDQGPLGGLGEVVTRTFEVPR